jgi:hypothetical protein
VHSFYTLEDAVALRDALERFDGGRLVVNLVDLPIKCPVAPLEFAFLAEAWLREHGLRERTEVTYVTPLDGAFTKPLAARELGGMFDERGHRTGGRLHAGTRRPRRRLLVSYDEREVPFDLLVTVPLNMGAPFVARSGLGDELNHVKVDKHTFLAAGHDDIFALGDAANLPTSKAGSVAHFAVDVFVDNFLRHIDGLEMHERFDGHANCFIESGDGKAMLLDFNYDTEPLLGEFPLPEIGPLKLLAESEANHWGKLAFRWIYWHVLLPGRPLPLSASMSMLGKRPAAPQPSPTATDRPPLAATSRRYRCDRHGHPPHLDSPATDGRGPPIGWTGSRPDSTPCCSTRSGGTQSSNRSATWPPRSACWPDRSSTRRRSTSRLGRTRLPRLRRASSARSSIGSSPRSTRTTSKRWATTSC